MSGGEETLARRVRFRCRSRGVREVGILLQEFVEEEELSAGDLGILERLLHELSDPDMIDCLSGHAPWPAWAGPVASRIDARVSSRRVAPS